MSRYLTTTQLPLAREALRKLFNAGAETGEPELAEETLFTLIARVRRAKKVKQKNNLKTQLTQVLNILENCGIINRTKEIDSFCSLGMVKKTRRVSVRVTTKTKRELSKDPDVNESNVYSNTHIDRVLVACGALYQNKTLVAQGPPENNAPDNLSVTTRKTVTRKSSKTTGRTREFIQAVRPGNFVRQASVSESATTTAAEKVRVDLDDIKSAVSLLQQAAKENDVLYAVDDEFYLFKSHRDALREMKSSESHMTPMAIRPLLVSLLDTEQPVPKAKKRKFPESVYASAPLLSAAPYLITQLVDGFKAMIAEKQKTGGFDSPAAEARLFIMNVLEIEHIIRDVKMVAADAIVNNAPLATDILDAYAARLDKEINGFKTREPQQPKISFLFSRYEKIPRIVQRNGDLEHTVKPLRSENKQETINVEQIQ